MIFYQNLTCIFVDDLNYRFFYSIFFRAPLIRMSGFVSTNGWMVQTTTLCVNLAWQQRQLLHFFNSQLGLSLNPQSFLWHYESQSSKLLNSCLVIV